MSISVNANQPFPGSLDPQHKNKELAKDKTISKNTVSDNLSLSRPALQSPTNPEIATTESTKRVGASLILDAESATAKLDLTTKYIFSNSKIALSAQSNITNQTALDLLKSN